MEPTIESRFGLADAFQVGAGDVVSLVGAGGKSTVLYGLVTELRQRGLTVIATTTTHIQSPDEASPHTTPPLVLASEESNWLETVRMRVARYGAATVVGARIRDDKLKGIEPREADLLAKMADALVVEADGARGRSLKAPLSHEPAIPPTTTLTVAIAAIDALGELLDETHVHRLEEVVKLAGASPGAGITPEILALALYRGYSGRVPQKSRVVFFLNKADDARLREAEDVGKLLLSLGATDVVFGAAQKPRGCFYVMRA